MAKHVKRLFVQFLVFLLLSLFFSMIPVLLGAIGNTSSYAHALFNIWYGLLPPIALLLPAYFFYRKEANWLLFWGRSWFGIGVWFLLQTILELLTKVSPLLALLSLPAKFTGGLLVRHPAGYITAFSGWWLLAGIMVFFIGGLALYILGNRFKAISISNFTFKRNRRTIFAISSGLLVVLLVISPLSIYFISKPTIGHMAKDVHHPTEQEIFDYIKSIYDFGPRRPGSTGYHAAKTHLISWFNGLNSQVNVEKTKFDYWEEKAWSLTAKPDGGDPAEIECFFWPYSGKTPEGGINAPLVYVGHGSEEEFRNTDVKGKVAMISLPPIFISWDQLKLFSFMAYDPDNHLLGRNQPYPIGWILRSFHIYPRVKKSGAVGAIYILENYPDMGPLSYYAPYDGKIRTVPGIYIRGKDGDMLKERLQKGIVKVNLVLDANISRGGGEAATIYTTLPGKKRSNFIVSSHFDSPWASGVEDSSGTGMVMALARYYAQIAQADRQRTLVFLLNGSHFVGEPSNKDFIEQHKTGILADNLFTLCIEHIADNWPYSNNVESRGVFFRENPIAIGLYAGLVQHYNLYGTLLFPTASPLGVPTDAGPLSRHGFPVVSYISGPVYLFDGADTLDRVPRDQLEPLLKLYIDYIENLNRYSDFMLRFKVNELAILLTVLVFSPLILIGFLSLPGKQERNH